MSLQLKWYFSPPKLLTFLQVLTIFMVDKIKFLTKLDNKKFLSHDTMY